MWSTAGPEGQAWILETIGFAGGRWTPPPAPAPITRGPPSLSLWRRLAVLTGQWPVLTPPGRKPLPRSAKVLKALTTEEIVEVHREAGRLRLGLGGGNPHFGEQLDAEATHYLVPDPAPYYWPDGDQIPWWQCRELLTMRDGTRVTSMVAVLPERFESLPDKVPRREQVCVVHLIRVTRYDLLLWSRDH